MPKLALSIIRPRHGLSDKWPAAFHEGLKRHGWEARFAEAWAPCDLLVVWATRRQVMMERQRAAGGAVCVLERGYIGDRFAWTSVSFGGQLNGRAEFRGVRDDPERFNQNFPGFLQPWRKRRNAYTLLIGQVPGDQALQPVGGSLGEWYRTTAAAAAKRGYRVRFRPHPEAARRNQVDAIPGVEISPPSLSIADDLAGAARVITFNSNAGVDAVLAGVPTMAADIGSMAYEVSSHAVGEPAVTPSREAWAARLAWKQWSLDEITAGFCWEVVGDGAV